MKTIIVLLISAAIGYAAKKLIFDRKKESNSNTSTGNVPVTGSGSGVGSGSSTGSGSPVGSGGSPVGLKYPPIVDFGSGSGLGVKGSGKGSGKGVDLEYYLDANDKILDPNVTISEQIKRDLK